MDVFDSHFHIIDPRHPLVPNSGYLPDPFGCADYLRRANDLSVVGGAVVSGSFQAFDQGYLTEALATLGRGFVGVTQLPATASDQVVRDLDAAGVRAIRFNVRRGSSESVDQLETFARRVHDLVRWHAELYIDSRELGALERTVLGLPAVSIDHLGLSRDGMPTLLRLAERGVRVKATGFGRVDFDVRAGLRDLYSANPDCLMFGTDLPSTRAPRPFLDADLTLIRETFDETEAAKVLRTNATTFYRVEIA